MSQKNTEFIVEDEDDDESFGTASFPDFDPSKLDSDSNIISRTAERRLFKENSYAERSDADESNQSPIEGMPPIDSKSRQVSVNENNKFLMQKKAKTNARNRSSEFSKKDLKMIDPSILHRNSNDLYRYKGKAGEHAHRRMYGSGFGLAGTGEKLQGSDSSVNGSLKDSMTRKKITAYKVSSKNSNQDLAISNNKTRIVKTQPISVIKRTSSAFEEAKERKIVLDNKENIVESASSPIPPLPQARKYLSDGLRQNRHDSHPLKLKYPKTAKSGGSNFATQARMAHESIAN